MTTPLQQRGLSILVVYKQWFEVNAKNVYCYTTTVPLHGNTYHLIHTPAALASIYIP